MLRASTQVAAIQMDLRSVGDPSMPSGRKDADALLRFTSALVLRQPDLDIARAEVAEILGPDAIGSAAAAAGNFEMMNRILDATGVPVPASMQAIAPELGVDISR